MKKLFLLLTTVMMLSVISVLGEDQPIIVDVGQDIHLAILPSTLDFDQVLPGTTNNPATEDITFDATGSNVDVHIGVTDVTGFPFDVGLKLNGDDPLDLVLDLECNLPSDPGICEYVPETVIPTLDIPLGTSQGSKAGTIVYTVTGPAP